MHVLRFFIIISGFLLLLAMGFFGYSWLSCLKSPPPKPLFLVDLKDLSNTPYFSK